VTSPSDPKWLPPSGWARYVAALWLAACLAVLAFTLSAYSPGPRSDAVVVFAWAMVALGFPASLLVSLALAAFLALVDVMPEFPFGSVPFHIGLPLVWSAFCAAGYAQWFVLIPRIWRSTHKSERANPEATARSQSP
jgi:hypothetical protein